MTFLDNGAAKRQTPKAQVLERYFEKTEAKHFGLDDLKQVIVVSDLHLGEGQLPDSAYWDRLENFTADEDFAEFLKYKQEGRALTEASTQERSWPVVLDGNISTKEKLLVINGDFIDFLRVMRTPQAPDISRQLDDWQNALATLPLKEEEKKPILGRFAEFREKWEKYAAQNRGWRKRFAFLAFKSWGIQREMKYGFKTDDYKSLYRLEVVAQGHAKVFSALAEWLKNGSALAITSGNHDQEMDQKLVQVWLQAKLEKLAEAEPGAFAPRLRFFPQGLQLQNNIRLEHGHRYEWHTATKPIKTAGNATAAVELPPGSYFNRYFINKVETVAPFIDNVRPVTRVIAYLVRHRTFESLGMAWDGLKAAFKLLFSGNGGVRFLGYGAIALGSSLFAGVNYLVWGVLFVLANCRALVANPAAFWATLAATIIFISGWKRISNRIADFIAGFFSHKKAVRLAVLLAVALLGVVLPLGLLLQWLITEGRALKWEILFVEWPAAESVGGDFVAWLMKNLQAAFVTVLTFLRPLALLAIAKWGLNLTTRGLRPHFNLKQVRAEMTKDEWSAAPSAEIRFAACGHTHLPDKQKWEKENVVYLNSGTWTRVFEYESDVVRDDFTQTFVEFHKDEKGKWSGELRRWEPQKIRENKVLLLAPRRLKAVREPHEETAAA